VVEKIYDTIKAILFTDFPKDIAGVPYVYDRRIENWFFGDRTLINSPLGVILKNTTSNIKDIGFGLREIEYSIKITFYSSNDDQETSERVVQESARIAHSILKNHRSMWICDLCPFCGLFPLSPIHYIDNGVITNVGIATAVLPSNSTSYKIQINGSANGLDYPALIKLSPGISGAITVAEILSCGLGITQTTYSDSYSQLNFTLSGGSGHTGYSTTLINNYVLNVLGQINAYWSETHTTGSPPYYDWAGVAYQAVQEFISDWKAGVQTAGNLNNSKWTNNLNSVINNNVDLMRYLQDIQVGDLTPSDDGKEQMFLHTAEFVMKAKEIVAVDTFGPNNVNVNAV